MANREELGIIRGARAGDAGSQLALGKLYLFGGASLPRSMPTALHWLNRAAQQQQDEAWRLIGHHIPFEHARHCLPAALGWYDRAYQEGIAAAGLVLAQLVLSQGGQQADAPLRERARQALEAAARSGSAEAQWLLASQPGPAAAAVAGPVVAAAMPAPAGADGQQWLTRAADNGVPAAQYAVLQQAWEEEDRRAFLERALPLARGLLEQAPADAEAARASGWQLEAQQVALLARCARALNDVAAPDPFSEGELQRCRELAAHGGDRRSQLELGLWFARMRGDGARLSSGIAAVNFKRAIRWLTQAGEQGLAEAWFALSRIYIKPEFSQRSVVEAQTYLERAADMGHSAAQLECGIHAWRTRRGDENSDVRAAYWLQKAAAQGCDEAEAALARIAAPQHGAGWAAEVVPLLTRELVDCQPLLAGRIELAALFGLTRAEALLLDMKSADQGHCLVVDIRAAYGRSKRRLILLRTLQQRQMLDRVVRLFERIDCGPNGPEGNYRQRLYRLKTWLPQAPSDGGLQPA
ncbi:SEL1-like repeat protein [Rugamonas sp. CCM 8940]|uniref:SEL1-like repeat protein n=1 Tax=Rugamonas sp. CCM 8940 TaxID=2765359 RepID=UPI0018F4CB31|nr:SEL1-like repeat protein [Rugamonas sp. CCM 8940]MBJ7310106.1 sel1 repeat family protein [Rugamonas sp. CCM 8940]